MGLLSYSGLISGMTSCLKTSFQDSSLLQKNKLISVTEFLSTTQMEELFHLPLSKQVWQEYQALQTIIQGIQIIGDKDCWKYIWGNSEYSSSKFYNLHYNGVDPPPPPKAFCLDLGL
jgi:hypothetical protein